MLDWSDLWRHLGPVALVVTGLLALMSMVSLAVMIDRQLTFRRAARSSRRIARDSGALLKAGRVREAAAWCRSGEARHSHVARALSAALDEFLASSGRGDDEASREAAIVAAKAAAAQAAAFELSDLKRGLGMLATIGSTAPFVGLFGTTFGIIDAFRSMALTGSGGIGAVSAGISEALVTTALGLAVAVPAVWAYNALAGRLERMGVEMERSAYELAVFLGRRVEKEAR